MKKSMIILPVITASLVSAAYAGEMRNVENARSAVPSLSVEQQDGTYVTVVDGYRRLHAGFGQSPRLAVPWPVPFNERLDF